MTPLNEKLQDLKDKLGELNPKPATGVSSGAKNSESSIRYACMPRFPLLVDPKIFELKDMDVDADGSRKLACLFLDMMAPKKKSGHSSRILL